MPALYIWHKYQRIRKRKGSSGFGPSPIEWQDIDAFTRLSGVRMTPWEIEMLERIDDAFLAALRSIEK